MKRKQVVVALGLAVVLSAAAFTVDRKLRADELHHFSQKFALLGTLRKSALDAYLDTVRGEITFWSVSESLMTIADELHRGWAELGDDASNTLHDLYLAGNPYPFGERARLADAGDGSSYSAAHAALHQLAAEFVTGRGYYDFFLIDRLGNIVYTVEKESDFATNLQMGPYRETGLANVFRQALEDPSGNVHFSDFERYAPSNHAPAIFIARRMTDNNGNAAGVLALQLPTARIMEIMQFDEGMGASGETYLVGEDLLMRSDSRFSKDSTILQTRVDTATVNRALAGERGIDFTPDYRGISVLSAYDWIDVDGFRWAVMAEIDEAEVRESTSRLGFWVTLITGLLYAFALWSASVLGRVALPDDAGAGVLPDVDVGQA